MSLAYSDTSSWFQHYHYKWRVLYCDMSTVTNYHCNLNSSTNTGPGQNSLNIRLFLQSDCHNIRYPLFLTVISITNVKRINLSLIPCSISYLIFIKSSPHRASHICPSSLRSDQMVGRVEFGGSNKFGGRNGGRRKKMLPGDGKLNLR